MELFSDLLSEGSLLGVALCSYASCALFGMVSRAQQSLIAANDPAVVHNTFGAIFKLIAFPINLWLAVYLSILEGPLLGIPIGAILFIGCGFLAVKLEFGGRLVGIHVVLGFIASLVGYYLTFVSLP